MAGCLRNELSSDQLQNSASPSRPKQITRKKTLDLFQTSRRLPFGGPCKVAVFLVRVRVRILPAGVLRLHVPKVRGLRRKIEPEFGNVAVSVANVDAAAVPIKVEG